MDKTSMSEVKCVEHSVKMDGLLEQVEEMHDSIREISSYVPKIEIALERLVDVRGTLQSFADVHKEIFRTLRELNTKLGDIDKQAIAMEVRLRALEESRRGVTGILSPVITWGIIAGISVLAALAVLNGVGQSGK